MSNILTVDKAFEGINFSESQLAKGDYENCTFVNCIFSSSDVSNITFMECEFENCNFSMANISNTAFKHAKFKVCKLLGLHFENCNRFLLSMDFDGCQLNLSSFYKLNLKNTGFKDCSLQEVDFTEADLTGISFNNCNLARAIFQSTILEKADLRTAYNFSIDPEMNRMKKTRFSKEGIIGLLDKYNIEVE